MTGAVHPRGAIAERYVIERELGRGAMGVVYLARDLRHERVVAIKVLPGELTGGLGAERFSREIRTLAGLSHPHILPLHDSGEVDGSLYFVMPLVEGESLRQRLEREGPLSVHDSLRLARHVAAALAYAHARGVVHRDIKPENILLDRHGNAYVADFGIARVLAASAPSARLTGAASRLGTPAYMSPEQVAGETELDGRSDIYSLGCVLYEMLANEPPFADANAAMVMRRHLIDEPAPLRSRRADVGHDLEALLRTALAKEPRDRFASAEDMRAALDAELSRFTGGRPASPVRIATGGVSSRTRRLGMAAALGVAVLAAALWIVGSNVTGLGWSSDAAPDSSHWVVLPLQWQGEPPAQDARQQDVLLHAAFARWPDLVLDDLLRVQEAVAERGGREEITTDAALAIARTSGAGRIVHGLAAPLGDSIRLDLRVADAANEGRTLRRVAMNVARGTAGAATLALIADSLLFGRVTWDDEPEADIGTRSSVARRAYGHAHEALGAWDLARADSLLVTALEHDAAFARAHLWLAQVRDWTGEPTERWRLHADRAAGDSTALAPRERELAAGLDALANARPGDACAAYDRLRARDDADFAAWFGLGECRRRDSAVVPDARSRSGWRFRGSYHTAATAYRRAFEIAPASHRAFVGHGFQRVRVLLYTMPGVRAGVGPDGQPFMAHPQWLGDTLALMPYRWDEAVEPPPERMVRMLRNQRVLFRAVATTWATAFPRSADALHALALSMEMLGDPAALQALRRARGFADSDAQRFRLAVREIWLGVKFGVPDGVPQLESAHALADSLLRHADADVERGRDLSALAMLLGRPARAAALGRLSAEADPLGFPAALTSRAEALLAFASAGGPRDSIAELERETEAAIQQLLEPAQRPRAREMYLERAAFLAFPHHVSPLLAHVGLQAPVARATAALARGDSAGARALVERAVRERDGMPPGSVSLDVLFAEARILSALDDDDGARAVLEPTLEALYWVQPGMLEDVARTGALVRAMALLAEAAAAEGDAAAARRWANAVVILWGNGEPGVTAIVERMRRLQRGT